ncbi:MAG: hypothetical protein K2X11_22760 [Acetobacteraceae bacterium]|nr:hypothetical protein [Acetobacteraceae bacterium]
MRLVLILLAAPLLMAQGNLPRPQCGFGEGLSRLRGAERDAGRPVAGLVDGRAQAEGVMGDLEAAAATFRACGCPRLAEMTAEAATVAGAATAEASAQRIQQVLGQTQSRARLARQVFESGGCR